ncbi:hypothetical protein AB6A40_005794 [Gnathostoma spinigerum]|uniref:Poly [ADP-ribose] polymerase n=1 Tax=Gnathostoma spinigerum TaxID=75299 RepID=A0ABD6EGG7_9BILA
MHACVINSEPIVRLLFGHDCSISSPILSTNPTVTTEKEKVVRQKNVRTLFLTNQSSSSSSGIGEDEGSTRNSANEDASDPGEDDGDGEADETSEAENANVDVADSGLIDARSSKTVVGDEREHFSPEISPICLRSKLDLSKTLLQPASRNQNKKVVKNFLHFMISPCGWENTMLLKAICSGTPQVIAMINKSPDRSSDRTYMTPMIAAKNANQEKMCQKMGELCGIRPLKIERAIRKVDSLRSCYDFDSDYQKFIEKDVAARREANRERQNKEKRLPHSLSGYRNTGEICEFKKSSTGESILFKVLMTKTDVCVGRYGFHNYYRMELIQRKNGNLFILFTHWGRIGDKGQYQKTPFSSREEGIKEFCSIFRSKSGNEFDDVENFIAKPQKYHLFTNESDRMYGLSGLNIDLKAAAKYVDQSKTDPIYAMVKDISDIDHLRRRGYYASTSGCMNVPFGSVSRRNLLDALEILKKIRVLVQEKNELLQRTGANADLMQVLQKIWDANNEFYKLVPVEGFETMSITLIEDEYTIDRYTEEIDSLMNMEVAGRIVMGAAEQGSTVDPILYIRDVLETEITLVDSESLISQQILQYIANSDEYVKVHAIFSVTSFASETSFNRKGRNVSNHRYLWHGTMASNLLSILKLGLTISPRNVRLTGEAFGKGIYFADVFAKSKNYCSASASNINYMLLCEVALGKMLFSRYDSGSVVPDCDTFKVMGMKIPNPNYDITLDDGVVMPLGRLIDVKYPSERKYNLSHNAEYVVRDSSHVTLRYIVAYS